ncbi:AAA family ATPase [Actinocorallia sp. API 0066]|uniref:AfsR/SARP family transcriptional regulator n=1 Tax=Actinocorallia sp. API 0066 TaxID=2896846 RepID=UPI001E2EFA5C|nr:AfsR/SARP family transcriptional regulator [Actinocorallia sp. API 0066]MCD0453530.1 AAA family ATPase [Actinocorallia sp. API 0066]
MVQIRALGALEARVAGRPADLGGTRQRAVLARLVAARGRMVPVERLIDDLWPGEAPARALAGVQAFVSHLRRALEPDRPPRTPATVLVTRPPGYALRLDDAAVDVWRFEDLVRRSAEPRAAWECADAALDLWRGPAYAEFADLPWAEAEGVRLEELRLTAVERRAAAMLRAGAAAQALPDLEAHTAAFPLREEPWRLLALGLYQAGRQADALAALRKVRALLADELGVDPGPPLQRLEQDILRQAAELTVGEPVSLVRRTPRAHEPEPEGEPLLGRESELAEVLAAVRAGRRVVLLTGEAGAGKTAFAERLCRDLAADGRRQAWGRAPEVDGAPAAWAWAELLRALHARHPVPDALADALAPLLDDDALVPAGDLSVARFRLHRAVARYLAGLSAETPLVVVLEDLHRADAETLGLLAGLPEQAPDVLFVGTYRPTEQTGALTDTLASLARHEPVRVELDGLSADAVADLVTRVCGREVAPHVLTAVAERTGGNPFFVRETARLLDAEGPEAALREVPSGVGDVLRRRVSRLPATAGTVLRTASVIGRDVDPDLLTAVCAVDEETVLEALEAALVTGLLAEDGSRVRFAHVLVRDTLYAELSGLRRARLHGRVAAVLEDLPSADASALAHHHLAAGTDLARAAHHAARAAEAAERRFAHPTAVELWTSALDAHTRAEGDPRQGMELTARLVRALVLSGEFMPARELRQGALPTLRELDDPELTARVLGSLDAFPLWNIRRYGQRDEELVALMDKTIERLPDGETKVRLLTSLAFELESHPEDRGGETAVLAVALARGLGGGELLASALHSLYTNRHRGAADLALREEIAREAIDVARAHGLGQHLALAHLCLHKVALGKLDFATARQQLDEGLRLAERYQMALLVGIAAWAPCMDLALAGRLDEAEAAYETVLASMVKHSLFGGEIGMAWAGRLSIRLTQGRIAELVDDAAVLYAMIPAGAARDAYVLTLAENGRVDEARAVFDPAEEIRADYIEDLSGALRLLAAMAVKDRAAVETAYTRLLSYADLYVGTSTGAVALCPAGWVLGEAAAFLGLPSASDLYARGAEAARKAGSRYWEERCLAQPAP